MSKLHDRRSPQRPGALPCHGHDILWTRRFKRKMRLEPSPLNPSNHTALISGRIHRRHGIDQPVIVVRGPVPAHVDIGGVNGGVSNRNPWIVVRRCVPVVLERAIRLRLAAAEVARQDDVAVCVVLLEFGYGAVPYHHVA